MSVPEQKQGKAWGLLCKIWLLVSWCLVCQLAKLGLQSRDLLKWGIEHSFQRHLIFLLEMTFPQPSFSPSTRVWMSSNCNLVFSHCQKTGWDRTWGTGSTLLLHRKLIFCSLDSRSSQSSWCFRIRFLDFDAVIILRDLMYLCPHFCTWNKGFIVSLCLFVTERQSVVMQDLS